MLNYCQQNNRKKDNKMKNKEVNDKEILEMFNNLTDNKKIELIKKSLLDEEDQTEEQIQSILQLKKYLIPKFSEYNYNQKGIPKDSKAITLSEVYAIFFENNTFNIGRINHKKYYDSANNLVASLVTYNNERLMDATDINELKQEILNKKIHYSEYQGIKFYIIPLSHLISPKNIHIDLTGNIYTSSILLTEMIREINYYLINNPTFIESFFRNKERNKLKVKI